MFSLKTENNKITFVITLNFNSWLPTQINCCYVDKVDQVSYYLFDCDSKHLVIKRWALLA